MRTILNTIAAAIIAVCAMATGPAVTTLGTMAMTGVAAGPAAAQSTALTRRQQRAVRRTVRRQQRAVRREIRQQQRQQRRQLRQERRAERRDARYARQDARRERRRARQDARRDRRRNRGTIVAR